LLGFLLVAPCCAEEPPPTFETLADDCRTSCDVVVNRCGDNPFSSEGQFERCTDYCIELKDSALEKGHSCAQRYEDMMTCVGATLEICDDWLDWARRTETGACFEESIHFDEQCGALE